MKMIGIPTAILALFQIRKFSSLDVTNLFT